MIFVTGDCHGNFHRFTTSNFPEQHELSKDDFVIICGDCGLVWDTTKTKQELYDIKWLDDKPWTTLFVDGNHENHERLNNDFPVEIWNGGKVHRIGDSVLHLMRGELYDIDGKRCFCFGGAASHDAEYLLRPDEDPNWKNKRKRLKKQGVWFRTEGRDWWASEVPSDDEKQHGIATLTDNDWKCDFVFTHTMPVSWIPSLGFEDEYSADPTCDYLEGIYGKLKYSHWFCGHMHVEKNISEKDHCLYHQIVRIA